jgi:hypothetical protein
VQTPCQWTHYAGSTTNTCQPQHSKVCDSPHQSSKLCRSERRTDHDIGGSRRTVGSKKVFVVAGSDCNTQRAGRHLCVALGQRTETQVSKCRCGCTDGKGSHDVASVWVIRQLQVEARFHKGVLDSCCIHGSLSLCKSREPLWGRRHGERFYLCCGVEREVLAAACAFRVQCRYRCRRLSLE